MSLINIKSQILVILGDPTNHKQDKQGIPHNFMRVNDIKIEEEGLGCSPGIKHVEVPEFCHQQLIGMFLNPQKYSLA